MIRQTRVYDGYAAVKTLHEAILKGNYFRPIFIDEAPLAFSLGAREAFRKRKYRFEAWLNYGFSAIVNKSPEAARRRRKQRPCLILFRSRVATPGTDYCQKSAKGYPSCSFSDCRIA